MSISVFLHPTHLFATVVTFTPHVGLMEMLTFLKNRFRHLVEM